MSISLWTILCLSKENILLHLLVQFIRDVYIFPESLPTSTAEHSSVTTHGSLQQPQQQSQSQPQWPPLLEVRELNTLHAATIPPYQFWNSEFRNKQPAFIRFNFTLPWGANFAVYGRRNVAPSVTQYDFVEFVKGGRVDHRLRKRSAVNDDTSNPDDDDDDDSLTLTSSALRHKQIRFPYNNKNLHRSDVLESISSNYEGTKKILADSDGPRGPFFSHVNIDFSMLGLGQGEVGDGTDMPHPTVDLGVELDAHVISKRDAELETMLVNVSLLQYLDTGRWFLSVYNDELQPHAVALVITEAEGVSTTCPNDCSGRGSCYLGKCDCIDGFQGIDCSKSKCSVQWVPKFNKTFWVERGLDLFSF